MPDDAQRARSSSSLSLTCRALKRASPPLFFGKLTPFGDPNPNALVHLRLWIEGVPFSCRSRGISGVEVTVERWWRGRPTATIPAMNATPLGHRVRLTVKHIVIVLFASLALGCGEDPSPEGEGAADPCGSASSCPPGLCVEEICLDGDDDADGDGLTNSVEVSLGTDPLNLDSDGDALVDSFEVADPSAPTDTDGDGVIDALESDAEDADCDNISDQRDPDSVTRLDRERDARGSGEVCLLDGDEDGIPDLFDCEPSDPQIGESCPAAAACFEARCQHGVGCVSEPVVFDDDNGCTADSCNQATGECVHGLIACDDDPCTDDVCDPATGACLTSLKDCDDDIPCTTDEHCEAGTGRCVATLKDCSDDNPCTDDVCLPNSGICQATDVVCDDMNACTFDQCDPLNGECIFQGGKCDDGSPCTSDLCDPVSGECTYETVDCDDQNACTVDLCDPETGGCLHEPKFCDDESLCTETVCDPATGWCDHPEIDCNDFNACTNEACDLETGECVYEPVVCKDVLQCTEDTCVESVGCVFVPTTCDDGDPCTEGACSEDNDELCVFTALTCDDGDPCTTDTCNPEFDGACSYEAIDCDDDDPCTTDSCDVVSGTCVHEALAATSLSFETSQELPSGVALWNASEEADEDAATGHAIAVCGGVEAPYYLASIDHGEITMGAIGVAAAKSVSGLAALEAHLEAMEMSLEDLHLKLGLAHLGADTLDVDWSFDPETKVEERTYYGGRLEVWLKDKPLIASNLEGLTGQVDHSVCEPSDQTLTLSSGPSFGLDLATGTSANADTQLAAQLLLQGLGIPAKLSLELTLPMESGEVLEAAGRSGILILNPAALITGQACGEN